MAHAPEGAHLRPDCWSFDGIPYRESISFLVPRCRAVTAKAQLTTHPGFLRCGMTPGSAAAMRLLSWEEAPDP